MIPSQVLEEEREQGKGRGKGTPLPLLDLSSGGIPLAPRSARLEGPGEGVGKTSLLKIADDQTVPADTIVDPERLRDRTIGVCLVEEQLRALHPRKPALLPPCKSHPVGVSLARGGVPSHTIRRVLVVRLVRPRGAHTVSHDVPSTRALPHEGVLVLPRDAVPLVGSDRVGGGVGERPLPRRPQGETNQGMIMLPAVLSLEGERHGAVGEEVGTGVRPPSTKLGGVDGHRNNLGGRPGPVHGIRVGYPDAGAEVSGTRPPGLSAIPAVSRVGVDGTTDHVQREAPPRNLADGGVVGECGDHSLPVLEGPPGGRGLCADNSGVGAPVIQAAAEHHLGGEEVVFPVREHHVAPPASLRRVKVPCTLRHLFEC
eukprot:Hpha_TRINITY_DN9519_c0_g1::TRINITY_DN9519_c0_g1_i1::g.114956::m.114956